MGIYKKKSFAFTSQMFIHTFINLVNGISLSYIYITLKIYSNYIYFIISWYISQQIMVRQTTLTEPHAVRFEATLLTKKVSYETSPRFSLLRTPSKRNVCWNYTGQHNSGNWWLIVIVLTYREVALYYPGYLSTYTACW